MKIAIYKHVKVKEALSAHGKSFFDRVIHESRIGCVKGLKTVPESRCEIYCFDGADVSDILPNLTSGFSVVVVFRVFSAEFF